MTFIKTLAILSVVIYMNIIGIICEYNPFHLGHIHHINKIKELYPNSLIILVLNGYFLERGEISILTKEDKTKIALLNNVDLVLELPFIYGTQSADIFANTAVNILNNFNIDALVFGSESNDVQKLKDIANIELNDINYNENVKSYLKEGINYPTALAKALDISDFNFTPNDLLGISYVKAIIKNNFNIEPITIKRTNDYKDNQKKNGIVSASNIREKLENKKSITAYVPVITEKKIIIPPKDKLFDLLKYKIITEHHLNEYLDVDEGIEYRLKKHILSSHNYKSFVENIKTKRYTYNKINRMLIHILIGLKKEDKDLPLEYIRVLGFTKKGQKYLNQIKDNLQISTNINKKSIIYQYELKAAQIYDLICNTKTKNFEEKKQPVIKD